MRELRCMSWLEIFMRYSCDIHAPFEFFWREWVGLVLMLTSDWIINFPEDYNPIRDYLFALPTWDGQNRVAELFGRIPGITAEQIYWLSILMRSAVAHWLGMDTLHGNECIPTLIGSQGCGKSTFWRRILPPVLRQYFLDHINLGNKFDKEMALTNNLLVNLDEHSPYA